jgi:CDGSH-type Zn-finger protein
MGTTSDRAVVTPCVDGPLLLRGDFEIIDQSGERIDPDRSTVALCRCGKSAVKPFCDGTHTVAGFRASSGRQER